LIAAAVFIFIYTDLVYGVITVLVGILLFVLMLYFKRMQEDAEKTERQNDNSDTSPKQ
jgi:vacuolar-type H+-ATPase subunit I/STV1